MEVTRGAVPRVFMGHMLRASLACVGAAILLGCSTEDTRVVFSQLSWMEWPAEVRMSQPFSVRLVGFNAGCGEQRFDPGTTIDNSAVTFEPFFVFSGPPLLCPLAVSSAPATIPIFAFYDVRSPVVGLSPPASRSYEIRGATDVSVSPAGPSAVPVRTFGEIVVRADSTDTTRTNAGGHVSAARDSSGCVTIFAGVNLYVVENPPADTATYWSAFVEGYLYKPVKPVCGDTVVFHLVSRN